jgi:DNA-binding CsgD family transcriptional regulator
MTQLNEKEIEIVQRIADGECLRTLSGSLKISYDYTKVLVQRIRKKIDCPTSENLVATAIRRGIID